MEQINIRFAVQEGACRRLIRLVEWRGGRVVAIDMVQEANGAHSQMQLVYAASGCEGRCKALIEKIRGIPGVAHVTRGDPRLIST